ncbi:MAG: hypothetical protein H6Q11_164 [Acidobacteria bacterium]|nr:hypothetical protein [Acidobacteriota bacterium]
MTLWKVMAAAAAVGAALLAGCGGGELVVAASTTTPAGADQTTTTIATTTTSPEAAAPITFALGIDDDGARLRVRSGDEVVPRLPLYGLDDPGWALMVPPDPAVLAGGDDLLWHPSEIDQGGVAFHEFAFIAAGPGETTVILTHGWQEFTFTVLVAGHQ